MAKALFQFTPLREGRRLPELDVYASNYFNSRPSARGDAALGAGAGALVGLFQFTPLREGRRSRLCDLQTFFISIHAPPRGATPAVGG